MPKIAELYQYPVAGMGGYQVDSLSWRPECIVGNRALAVVLETQLELYLKNRQQLPLRATQTGLPNLALFTTSIRHGEVIIKYQNQECSTGLSMFVGGHPLPFLTDNDQPSSLSQALKKFVLPFRVSTKSSSARWAVDGGDKVANWLSVKLGKKVRLIKAVANPEAAKHHFTWYTDLHIITQASLQALSELAGEQVDPRAMRANIVLSETVPFEELTWQGLILGGVEAAISNCLRCGYIAIDQDTATRAAHMPILNTVQEHFQLNFGVYAKPSGPTTVRVGDSTLQRL